MAKSAISARSVGQPSRLRSISVSNMVPQRRSAPRSHPRMRSCSPSEIRANRLGWQLRLISRRKNGLAADDEQVLLLYDLGCGAEDVFELLPPHAPDCFQYRAKESSTSRRSLSGSTPGNGEFCRSSAASGAVDVSVSITTSGPLASTSCQRLTQRSAVLPE